MLSRLLWTALFRFHAAVYRASGGRLMNRIGGAPVLLLTTVGYKTGKRHRTPLAYLADGESYVLVASAGGAPWLPAWYLNLRESPEATIQVGSRKLPVSAETASPEERRRLWPEILGASPGYDEYEKLAGMEYPVVVLRVESNRARVLP